VRDARSCLAKGNPCPFAPCPIIFMPLSQHYVISQWCSHINRCYHQPQQIDLVSHVVICCGVVAIVAA
jgi:hypothetical protein